MKIIFLTAVLLSLLGLSTLLAGSYYSVPSDFSDSTKQNIIDITADQKSTNLRKDLNVYPSENIAVTTNDISHNSGDKMVKHQMIHLIEKVQVSTNNFENNEIVMIKQSLEREVMERILYSERIGFNEKPIYSIPSQNGFTTLDAVNDQVSVVELPTTLRALVDNKVSTFDQIFSAPYHAGDFEIQKYEEFSKVISDVATKLSDDSSFLIDAENPLLLLFLVPLAGFILIRSKERKIVVRNFNQIMSLGCAAILLSSGITLPMALSSSYWGYAYGEEMPTNTSSVPSAEQVNATTAEPVNATTAEIPANYTSAEIPANYTSAAIPANYTSAAIPANYTSAEIPANYTSAAIPANYTSAEIPVNATSAEIPVNATSAEPITNATSAEIPVNATSAEPITNATSAEIPVNATSAEPITNATSAEIPVNATSAEPITNATSAEIPVNATSVEPVEPEPEVIIPEATISLQFNDPQPEFIPEDSTSTDAQPKEATLELSGDGGFIQIENVTVTNDLDGLTVTAWVKPDYSAGSSEFTVLSKEKSFSLTINNNIQPQQIAKFSVFDGIKWTTIESTSIIEEKWTFLSSTFNGETIAIFVNGVKEGTKEIAGVPTLSVSGKLETTTVENITSEEDIVFGASVTTKNGNSKLRNQFSGEIDDVLLYDYVLDDEQILAMYEQSKDAYEALDNTVELSIEEIVAQIAAELAENNTTTEPVVNATSVESVSETSIELLVTPELNSVKESYLITEDAELTLEYYDEYDVLMKELEEIEAAMDFITAETEFNLLRTEKDLDIANSQTTTVPTDPIAGFLYHAIKLLTLQPADAAKLTEEDKAKIEIAKVKEEIQKLKDKIAQIKQSGELNEEDIKEAKGHLKEIVKQIRLAGDQITKTSLKDADQWLKKSADGIEKIADLEEDVPIQSGDWKGADETIVTEIYDPEGNLINLNHIVEKLRDGKFTIKLILDRDNKPGLYKIITTLTKNGETFVVEDEFAWGVLAINTDKSIFLPNEDAFIAMAVLDDEGKTVCDADVTLTITDPSGAKTTLTTASGEITISEECKVLGVTNLPDYYTEYTVNGIGIYTMDLTAVTYNGARSIQDRIDVQSTVEFDVTRDGPTRIYPLVPYTVDFTIKANADYNGKITEYVPASFEITPRQGLTEKTGGDTKTLSWDVNLQKGETINLFYEFDAPDISPAFYLLGPLEIGGFAETRQWQVASDVITVGQFAVFSFSIIDEPILTLTVAADDTMIIAGILTKSGIDVATVSSDLDGAFTSIGGTGTGPRVEQFYLIPSTTGTHTITFTVLGEDGVVGVMALKGTATTAPADLGGTTGTSTTPSFTTTTSGTNSEVVAIVGSNEGNTMTLSGTGQTFQWEDSAEDPTSVQAEITTTSNASPGSNPTVSWTQDNPGGVDPSWAIHAIEVFEAGPSITSIEASDPDAGDTVFGNDDIITVTFSEDTNTPLVKTKADLDALFTFSQDLGADYTGKFKKSDILVITIVDSSGATPPEVGVLTLTVIADGVEDLKNKAETSPASTSLSPTLTGNFGTTSAPSITAAQTLSDTQIQVTYSENVDVTTTDGAGFILSIGTVSANTDPAGVSTTITLTVSGITTGDTPNVIYTALAGSVVDTNANAAADQTFTGTTDGAAPTITSATTTSTTTIDLTASETVTSTAAAADFTVNGIGVNTVGTVSASGTTITLTLSSGSMSDTDIITVDYTRINSIIIDSSSNILANFAGQSVTNTLDTTAPTFSAITPTTGSTVPSGFSVGYTLDEASSSGSITFTRTGGTADATDHVYTMVAGDLTAAAHTISQSTLEADAGFNALVDGSIYTIDFSATDAAANTGTAQVTSITVDTTAPTLNSAQTLTTTTIDVTFSEDLDGTTVEVADFTVDSNTVSNAVESSAGVVTLTLSTAIATDATPLVTLVGSVSDVAGNAQTSGSATPTDGIAPTFTATTATLTTTTVTFSEPVDGTFTATDWLVAGVAATGIYLFGAQTSISSVTLFHVSTGDTGAHTRVQYSSGDLADSSANVMVGATVTASDGIAPTITSITSDAKTAGVLKVDNTITFTLTPGATEAGVTVTGSYNSVFISWSTADGGATYTATYTVSEGDADQATALQISGVTITDAAGNTSATAAGTDVVKTIDANSPTMDSAETKTTTTIDVTFSEDLDGTTVDATDFTLDLGLTVSSASETSAGVVTITTTTEFGIDDTPAVTLVAGGVDDTAGNTLASAGPITATDGIEIGFNVTNNGSTTGSQISFSISPTSTDNTLLVVGVSWRDEAALATNVTKVEYDTASNCLTSPQLLDRVTNTFASNNQMTSEIFILKSPPAVDSFVCVTFSEDVHRGIAGAVVYMGVDQTTPTGDVATNSGQEDPATVILNNIDSGNSAFAVVSVRQDGAITQPSGNDRWNVGFGGGQAPARMTGAGVDRLSTTPSETFTWTDVTTTYWAASAVEINTAGPPGEEDTPPGVTITTVPTSPSSAKISLVYTFEWDEAVTGFDAADITLAFAGAAAGVVDGSTFVAVDADTYTLTLANQDLTDLGALTTGQTVVATVAQNAAIDATSNTGPATATSNTWTFKTAGPSITSIEASDPDAGDAVYGNDDIITVTFSEDTNTPLVKTKADLDALFTFSQDLGTDYTGKFKKSDILVITIVDSSGATPPAVGVLTLTVIADGVEDLKNSAGTSAASTSLSPTLTGNFGTKVGPSITSIEASDPDAGDAVYGNDDIITVTFSEDTNTPLVKTKADLDALFTFSQDLGTDYTGKFKKSDILVITIVDSSGATPPAVGVLTLTVIADGVEDLKNSAGTSAASTSLSPTLTGTFSKKLGPSITSIEASDPDGGDSVFGNDDTITVKFSEETNTPLVKTKADLDGLFTFSQVLGADYEGRFTDRATLVITIVDSSGATPPAVGVLTLTVIADGVEDLKNSAGTSAASTSISPTLTGNFGTKAGPSITSIKASDPDSGDSVFGNDDIITVAFSENTNSPVVVTKADLDALFTFSQDLGDDYIGSWKSKSVLVITIIDSTGATPPAVGVLTLTVIADGVEDLKNKEETSDTSTSTSPALEGSFSDKTGPSITSIVAADPDGSDAVFSNSDTITVRFSEATNQPSVATKADLDALFTFSQSIGADYSGTFDNPSTLVITIDDSTTDAPPLVGELKLTVRTNGVSLKDAAEESLASTAVSPPLTGTFGKKKGPFITSLVALDPFDRTTAFGNDDTITITFSEATNKPPVATKANLDALFTFSQVLGADYEGTFTDRATLVITIVDSSGATPPAVGDFRVKVNADGVDDLKDSPGTSLASVAESAPLTGTFATREGPSILSIEAADPDGADAVFGNGDTITVKFSEATNEPDVATKADLDALFTFSQVLGADYTGSFVDPETLTITIVDSAGATPPAVGTLTLTVKADGNLKSGTGTSAASTSTSPSLQGSFGDKTGPSIKAIIADDPDDSDSIFSNGDTITVKFSEETNKPAVATKADLDALFIFSQSIGDDYSGTFRLPSTLVITIDDAANIEEPPAVGELILTVKASGALKDKAGTSLASKAVSPSLGGTFGTFSEETSLSAGGTAFTTLPAGTTTKIKLDDDVSGVITVTRVDKSVVSDAISDTTDETKTAVFLGNVMDITPSEGATCSPTDPCTATFSFTQDGADAAGVEPLDVKILHDKNNDNDFSDAGEVLATTVNEIVTGLFEASATIDSNSKFAMAGIKTTAKGTGGGGGGGGDSSGGGSTGTEPGAAGASSFGVILFSPLKINEISYDVCSENMVEILVANDDAVIPTVTLQTTKSGTIEAVLATEQPFEENNKFTTVDKYLFVAPLDPKETFFMVQVKAADGVKINSVNSAIYITECQGVIQFDEIPEEFEGINFAAPRIFDVKIQIDNGTLQSAISPETTYLDEQELTVSAIVNSQVPLKQAELRYGIVGQPDDYITFQMDINPLEGVETAAKISASIPPVFMVAPGIEYWIHVMDEILDEATSQHYTMGVKPDYDVDASLELDIPTSKPEGSTIRPSAYITNHAEEPAFGTVSLLVDGKVVSSTTEFFGAGETKVPLEWVIPKERQHMVYAVQAKLDLYDTSATTEKAYVSSFMKTQIISLSEMQTILPITDQAGNTVAQPALLYASYSEHDNLRFRVMDNGGFCFIGATDECAIKESTLGNRGGIQSIEHNEIIYRVKYSGADSPLERFSITSVDQVGTDWNITLESTDDFIPQAFAMQDVHLKVKYRTISEMITVSSF